MNKLPFKHFKQGYCMQNHVSFLYAFTLKIYLIIKYYNYLMFTISRMFNLYKKPMTIFI